MKSKCHYDLLEKDLINEYQTSCGRQMDEEDLKNICPNFCPYCGEEVIIK
tara:strand:- start:234 stop:383 length:150 start_codon:yes stop_codon:yes gene_type:complete